MSCTTDLSPTASFVPRALWYGYGGADAGGGGGVPGGGDVVGGREGYTGTPPDTLPDPKTSIFKAKGPTYGQMKLNLRYFMRFLRIDPQMTLR